MNELRTIVTEQEFKELGQAYFDRQNAVLLPAHGTDHCYVVDTVLSTQIAKLHNENEIYQEILLAYLTLHPVENGTDITLGMIRDAVTWALNNIKNGWDTTGND